MVLYVSEEARYLSAGAICNAKAIARNTVKEITGGVPEGGKCTMGPPTIHSSRKFMEDYAQFLHVSGTMIKRDTCFDVTNAMQIDLLSARMKFGTRCLEETIDIAFYDSGVSLTTAWIKVLDAVWPMLLRHVVHYIVRRQISKALTGGKKNRRSLRRLRFMRLIPSSSTLHEILSPPGRSLKRTMSRVGKTMHEMRERFHETYQEEVERLWNQDESLTPLRRVLGRTLTFGMSLLKVIFETLNTIDALFAFFPKFCPAAYMAPKEKKD